MRARSHGFIQNVLRWLTSLDRIFGGRIRWWINGLGDPTVAICELGMLNFGNHCWTERIADDGELGVSGRCIAQEAAWIVNRLPWRDRVAVSTSSFKFWHQFLFRDCFQLIGALTMTFS